MEMKWRAISSLTYEGAVKYLQIGHEERPESGRKEATS